MKIADATDELRDGVRDLKRRRLHAGDARDCREEVAIRHVVTAEDVALAALALLPRRDHPARDIADIDEVVVARASSREPDASRS